MKPSPVLIKKYGNRRLYDSSNSKYVNLDDLATFIREGKEVKVVDAKTGQDLTRVTLTQIITEDAKEKPTGLPLELLRQLIVASDEAGQEFVMWYLKSAFDTYQKVKDGVQSRLGEVQSTILSPGDTLKNFLSLTPSSDPNPNRKWIFCVSESQNGEAAEERGAREATEALSRSKAGPDWDEMQF